MTRLFIIVPILAMLVGCSDHRANETPKPKTSLPSTIVVSEVSLKSDDPYDVILSNIDFLNAQLAEHLRRDELSPDGLRSYYVDYYLAQVNNGGFSQFVYNSRWDEDTIRLVREGLRAMGAKRHLDLFNESASIIERIDPEGMKKFIASEYFGDNKEREVLNAFDKRFYDLSEREDLIQLNSSWLKSLPHLVTMTTDEMKAEVERRAIALPDREARKAKSLADEPRYMKLIRALCKAAGQKLDRVTAGDPTFKYKGQQMLSWHFLTDQGHFHMADLERKALMFKGHTDEVVCEIDLSEEFGTE